MKGQIVVLPFPFTDLVTKKVRPALVLDEWNAVVLSEPVQAAVVCQITSQNYHQNGIEIDVEHVTGGTLAKKSWVIPSMVFTVSRSKIVKLVGDLVPEKHQEVVQRLVQTIKP